MIVITQTEGTISRAIWLIRTFILKNKSINSLYVSSFSQSVTKYLSVYHTPRAVLVLGTVINKTDKDQTKKGIKAKEYSKDSGF